MTINSQLEELYRDHWNNFVSAGALLKPPYPTNPMLLSIPESALKGTEIKVMICGQETKGWHTFKTSISEGMEGYKDFHFNRKYYPGYRTSAFWKAFRYFESMLPKALSKKCTFIYQNVNKIGRRDNVGVTKEIKELERSTFSVFQDELRIVTPDILLFLTGPNRDHDIKFHFPDLALSAVEGYPNLRHKAWLSSENLPSLSMRLYHPCYYRAWSNVHKENTIQSIIKKLNKSQ